MCGLTNHEISTNRLDPPWKPNTTIIKVAIYRPRVGPCLQISPGAVQVKVSPLDVAGRGPGLEHVGVDREAAGDRGEPLVEDHLIMTRMGGWEIPFIGGRAHAKHKTFDENKKHR